MAPTSRSSDESWLGLRSVSRSDPSSGRVRSTQRARVSNSRTGTATGAANAPGSGLDVATGLVDRFLSADLVARRALEDAAKHGISDLAARNREGGIRKGSLAATSASGGRPVELSRILATPWLGLAAAVASADGARDDPAHI